MQDQAKVRSSMHLNHIQHFQVDSIEYQDTACIKNAKHWGNFQVDARLLTCSVTSWEEQVAANVSIWSKSTQACEIQKYVSGALSLGLYART